MKKPSVVDLSDSELIQKELDLRNELAMLKVKRQIGQIEKSHRFSKIRREIARVIHAKNNRKAGTL